jgi:hypothetical protein
MNTKSIAISAILGAVGGAVLSYFVMDHRMSDIDERLLQSPPVVVVDFAQMAMRFPEGATPEEVEGLMMETNRLVLRLQEAGYLVLDAGAVLAAPVDLYLPEDVIQ